METLLTSEGFVRYMGKEPWRYYYHIKDHEGNKRMVFTDMFSETWVL